MITNVGHFYVYIFGSLEGESPQGFLSAKIFKLN